MQTINLFPKIIGTNINAEMSAAHLKKGPKSFVTSSITSMSFNKAVKNYCTIFRSDRNMNGPYSNFNILRCSCGKLVLTCCHTTTRELNLKYFDLWRRKDAFKGLEKVFLCAHFVIHHNYGQLFLSNDRQNNKLTVRIKYELMPLA